MRRARFEQTVDELLGERMLTDQGMRKQRLARDDRIATHRSARGEALVRGDVLHQPQ